MTARRVGKCIIAGCAEQAANKIDIRVRRDDKTALWVRGTGALICDTHANGGLQLRLALTPLDTGKGPITSITTVGMPPYGLGQLDREPPRTVIREPSGKIVTGDEL